MCTECASIQPAFYTAFQFSICATVWRAINTANLCANSFAIDCANDYSIGTAFGAPQWSAKQTVNREVDCAPVQQCAVGAAVNSADYGAHCGAVGAAVVTALQ